jgi:hypothetical protein
MDFLLGPLKRYLASMLQSRLAEYFENIELDGELHSELTRVIVVISTENSAFEDRLTRTHAQNLACWVLTSSSTMCASV